MRPAWPASADPGYQPPPVPAAAGGDANAGYPISQPGFAGYQPPPAPPRSTWEDGGLFAAQLGADAGSLEWHTTSERTGVVPLRPLSLGDILSGAFRAVRYNAPATMGLTFVVMLGLQLVVTLVAWAVAALFGFQVGDLAGPGSGALSSDVTATVAGLVGVSGLVTVVAMMALMPMLSYVVCEGVAAHRVTPADALRRWWRRLPATAGFMALVAVAIGVAVVVWVGVAVGISSGGVFGGLMAVVAVLGVLGGIALVAWLVVRLGFALPSIGVECTGPVAAIRRSWGLTRGRFWRTFGIQALTGVIVGIAAGTFSQILSIVDLVVMVDNPVVGLASSMVTSMVAAALCLPLEASVTALLYTDARIRDEGLDLALAEEFAR